jgi:hypothetical protein
MTSLSRYVEGTVKYGLRAQMLRAKLGEGLQAWYKKRQELRYADKSSGVHVANLLGKEYCERQVYYQHAEGEVGIAATSDRTLMTWYEGVKTEEQFKELLDMAGVDRLSRGQVHFVGRIVGSPDDFLTFMSLPWIAEVKSIHHAAFGSVKPWRDVLQQIGSYMALYAIPRGVIAIKGKGRDDWKFFEVQLEDVADLAKEALVRGLRVSRALETETVPPRIEGASLKHKKCKKCAFRAQFCFGRDREIP